MTGQKEGCPRCAEMLRDIADARAWPAAEEPPTRRLTRTARHRPGSPAPIRRGFRLPRRTEGHLFERWQMLGRSRRRGRHDNTVAMRLRRLVVAVVAVDLIASAADPVEVGSARTRPHLACLMIMLSTAARRAALKPSSRETSLVELIDADVPAWAPALEHQDRPVRDAPMTCIYWRRLDHRAQHDPTRKHRCRC